MGGIDIKLEVLNQLQTPAFYAASLANRPAFGFAGRVFIDTDIPSTGLYRDTGTAWVSIADPGAGTTGTLQQVTTNGNTTAQGIAVSANGIGIGTTIPGTNRLDIHSASGLQATFNGTTTTNAGIQLQNAGVGKWTLQNNYNAGANDFLLIDVAGGSNRMRFTGTGNSYINADLTLGNTFGTGVNKLYAGAITVSNISQGAATNYNALFYTGGAVASYLQLANGSTGAGAGNGMLIGLEGGGNGRITVQGAFGLTTTVAGVQRYDISSGGTHTITGPAIFSSTLGIGGVTDSVKGSTYTPTLTNIVGASGLSANVSQYIRVGNIVTVSFNCTGTGTGVCLINMSIPVGNSFTSQNQANGSGVTGGNLSTYNPLSVYADSASANVIVVIVNGASTTFGIRGTFQYQIQ